MKVTTDRKVYIDRQVAEAVRKSEVLEALLLEIFRQENPRIISQTEFKRKLGNLSKSTGIPEAEIREVVEPIIMKLMNEMLA